MIRLSSVIEAEITCVARVALRERKVPRNISDASPLSPSSPGILIARLFLHRVINNTDADQIPNKFSRTF